MAFSDKKIVIIGAGPAGCTTALRLSNLGISSTLVDKAIFPRDKICGDALSGKVMAVMKLLHPDWVNEIANDSKYIGSYGVVFTSPSGDKLRLPFGKVIPGNPAPGFVSKRIDFDNWLVEKVRQRDNIEFLENTEIRNYKQLNESWIATTKIGSEIEASFIVAADGAYSSFTKDIAKIQTEPEHNCYGLRAYYSGVSDMDAENFIELHFIKGLLPGYVWIFPLPNGEANVGLGIRADYQKKKNLNLKKELLRILETHPQFAKRFKNAKLIDDVKLFGLPLGSKKRKLFGENYLLTGDAAMLIDPFTGEGIGNAMVSGLAAADAITTYSKSNNVDALSEYQETIERKLRAELQLSHKLQQLANYPMLFNFVVKAANSNKAIQDTFSAMFYDVNIRAKLKSPKFYMELLFSSFKK
jgi:geranylgeranyl reductase family protein